MIADGITAKAIGMVARAPNDREAENEAVAVGGPVVVVVAVVLQVAAAQEAVQAVTRPAETVNIIEKRSEHYYYHLLNLNECSPREESHVID